jgi:hypothetical protein
MKISKPAYGNSVMKWQWRRKAHPRNGDIISGESVAAAAKAKNEISAK